MVGKKKAPASRSKSTSKSVMKSKETKPARGKKAGNQKEKAEVNPNSIVNQLIPYILGFVALFCGICLISERLTGFIGVFMRSSLYGLFSWAAILVPFMILNVSVFWKRDIVRGMVKYKVIFSFAVLIFISVLIFIAADAGRQFDIRDFWNDGIDWHGGGAVGGTLGWVLHKAVGTAGTIIIAVAMLFIFGIFMFGLTPYDVWVRLAYFAHISLESYRQRREALIKQEQKAGRLRAAPADATPQFEEKGTEDVSANHMKPVATEKNKPVPTAVTLQKEKDEPEAETVALDTALIEQLMRERDNQPPFDVDENIPVDKNAVTAEIEKIKPVSKRSRAAEAAAQNAELDSPLSHELLKKVTETSQQKAAATPEELALKRTQAVSEKAPPDNTKIETYTFPPSALLKAGPPPANVDISEELQTTAKKLVDTLNSFKVRTKIVDFSRGPTITRYELAPEEGVRVRSIAGLIDDIALNLATTGIRIEAPIPGKQAVGIEVPNRVIATVYLKGLIENPKFSAAPSKVSVCLGEDVAGEPIYVDISKMPHLLIAGATGMGKSVCINSMIMSLLYKASPDELKLILVDPKKVELNVYNGLPHLLVPVVSDPKKAAGSLQWAVNEMERRFTLIEEVGMRDLKGYNTITKEDPEKEFLPHIVIIIDELADLMMTASDDVEESICRLAQKARAAGMHLIIGTQRPSVDVITGLIKANIPSRIAFTVASQVDSRTIIDIAGAEKLIGRGDMLYAPVGAPKPIRVQGAFVSEKEIEEVTTFIKEHYGVGEYSPDIMESIEKEAARCGSGKKLSGGDEDTEQDEKYDPMLKPAIELAVESGKISTSLIQRRLELGYGRAAKLIDRMERMGIVSAPEGQKPRTVLISRQQYMEMVLSRDEI